MGVIYMSVLSHTIRERAKWATDNTFESALSSRTRRTVWYVIVLVAGMLLIMNHHQIIPYAKLLLARVQHVLLCC